METGIFFIPKSEKDKKLSIYRFFLLYKAVQAVGIRGKVWYNKVVILRGKAHFERKINYTEIIL